MVSVQERLQLKREPLDKWSTREQLCLASAVVRSGDQNWMSVSRSLKPFGEPNRPADWFHQKNCAAQYGALLENVETPKRKKRPSGVDVGIETPAEAILRKLSNERRDELRGLLAEEKVEYQKLQEEMSLLQSGSVSEEQLERWCKEIDEEERRKEQEALVHAQWLKEREDRKQEIERVWRPIVKGSPMQIGQKRKGSDSLSLMDLEASDELHQQFHESGKPALSPLLTSLLKSPSQVSNTNTTSILHTAITSQRMVNTVANPTIAGLLNSSPGVSASSSLQHLVSSALGQDVTSTMTPTMVASPIPDLLEDSVDTLPNIKMEDLESTILSSDEPLPEIKNEEVEVIMSDLMDVDDIVNDPEQHLKLGENDDIITNLENELKELCEKEELEEESRAEVAKQLPIPPPPLPPVVEKAIPKIDPFEFEEDPEIYQPTKPSIALAKQHMEVAKQQHQLEQQMHQNLLNRIEREHTPTKQIFNDAVEVKKEVVEEPRPREKPEVVPGSVEIVEVVVLGEDEIEKQLNKSQIQDIVHSHKPSVEQTLKVPESVDEEDDQELIGTDLTDAKAEVVHADVSPQSMDAELDAKQDEKDQTIDIDLNEPSQRNTFTPEYSEEFYDDISIEVTKLDKSGKAKRDYSRTKKKEEKDFDILLAVEKAVNAQLEENELGDESFSDKEYRDMDKKFLTTSVSKLKSENERSNSPWTEEEEIFMRTKRRYSTPATPVDSVPNSPASSIAYYDDDRDYRNWKKSVMLVYSRLATHKYASLFLKPITDDQAPGYHSIIYRPMDLQTIRKNIENGLIRTTMEFQRDVLLMFNNATMYNRTNGHVYSMARQMQLESIQQIQLFLQAQAQDDAPARRETRTSEPGNKRKRVSEDFNIRKKRKDD